jgi:hypothetical protein
MMHLVNLDIAQYGSLDAAIGKINARAIRFDLPLSPMIPAITMLDLCRRELHCCGIAARG